LRNENKKVTRDVHKLYAPLVAHCKNVLYLSLTFDLVTLRTSATQKEYMDPVWKQQIKG